MPLIVRTTGLAEYMEPGGEAFVKCLVLGHPGSGKTPFASSWPKPFYIAAEDGMMSVARKALPFVRVETAADYEAAVTHLRQLGQRPPAQRPYQTVVVDTIDSYQKLLIQQRLKSEGKPGMQREDWNWLATRMDAALHDLLNLKMNVVVLMHDKDMREDYAENGEDKVRTYKANALKGDVKDTIYGNFDLIGYIEPYRVAVDGQPVTKRRILWEATDKLPMLRHREYEFPSVTQVDFTAGDYERIFDGLFSSVTSVKAGEEVEQIAVEDDGAAEPAPADLPGGPVADPAVPKPAAKKAAAKKTAAKKAAPAETATDVPEATKPTTAPSTAAAANAKATAESPVVPEADRADHPAAPLNESGTGSAPRDGRQEAARETGDKLEAERQERIAAEDAAAKARIAERNELAPFLLIEREMATEDDWNVARQRKADGAQPNMEGIEPDPTEASTQEQPSSSESSPASQPAPAAEASDQEQATEVLAEKLGATPVADEPTTEAEKATADKVTGEIPPRQEPAAPVAPPAAAAKSNPALSGKSCGDAVPGQTPTFEGCGRDLSEAPTVKLMIAQLRTKAYLCDDCFEKSKTPAA